VTEIGGVCDRNWGWYLTSTSSYLARGVRDGPADKERLTVKSMGILCMLVVCSACGGSESAEAVGCPDSVRNAQGLVFTAMDVPPKLVSRDQALAVIAAAKETIAPRSFGTARMWFTIDESGRVIRAGVAETSGQRAVDSAATTAGRNFRFAPALLNGQRVCSSIQLPVVVGKALNVTNQR